MYKHRQNSKALAILIIVALMVVFGASISVAPEMSRHIAADTIIIDSDFFYPLADEKTEVFISLKPAYQLLYKGTSYITNQSGTYYTDEDLFAILEFEDALNNQITDLTATDIVVTGVTEMKDFGSYPVTFSISEEHSLYFGELSGYVDISKKELDVALATYPQIYYGQTLESVEIVYSGFAAPETAAQLISSGDLGAPTINNIGGTALDPTNNGSIFIELNSDGWATNYTLNIDSDQKALTVNKARVSISLDSDSLPYIYMDYVSGGNPTQQLYDILSFTNTDISETISANLPRTDISVVSPLSVMNADSYQLVLTINSANDYYTILPSQSYLPLSIDKASFNYIDSANITTYFDFNAAKTYDGTTDMDIDISQASVVGINGENLTITGVSSQYSSKDAGTRSFTVTFTINSNNYTIAPILMQGAQSGSISAHTVTDVEPLRFIGVKLQKEYDTTTNMLLYERVYFIKESYMSVFSYLSDYFNNYYGLSLENAQQLVDFWTCFTVDQATDDYIILRLDYYQTLNMIFGFWGNAQSAQIVLDDIITDLNGLLDSQSFIYDFYSGELVGDLYFTEFNEVILLSDGASHISAQYDSKDAITEFVPMIDYNINYAGFSHTNYTLSGTDINGESGIILKATIGVYYPTVQKTYGQPNPTGVFAPFFDVADLEAILGTTIIPNGNEVYLPIASRAAISLTEYMYFNRVLTGFYDADLAEPEVAALVSGDGLYYVYDEDDTVYNVYVSYEDYLAGKKARYNLAAFMPIKNYNFLAILNLYDNSYYAAPGLQVNPVEIVIDTADIEYSKVYSRDENTDFSNVSINVTTSSFIPEEEPLFYLEFIVHFLDSMGNRVNNVASGLSIGDFEFFVRHVDSSLDYSQSELEVMACNYKIDIQSFCDIIYANPDVFLEVFIDNENTWVSYADYMLLYSDRNILNCRISEVTLGTIAITPAQLVISIEPGQSFDYGNDILVNLQVLFSNFYQYNPASVFDISYDIKNMLGDTINNEENNALPTELLPSADAYNILLTSYDIVDTDWLSQYGGNYDISIDISAVEFYVNKPLLEYSIAPVTKTFGEFDPEFSFNSLAGARDSDIEALTALLSRTEETLLNENAGSYVVIELRAHEYYNYVPNTAELTITPRTISIFPTTFEVEYGVADSLTMMFTVSQHYVEYTPMNPEGIDLTMDYTCQVSTLDAGADYIHNIISAQMSALDENQGNFFVSLNPNDGLNKIRIIPKSVTVDISELEAQLTKVYDAQILRIVLKDENSFDYYNQLQGLLTPDQIEESGFYVDLLSQLAYQERLFYAAIGGYATEITESMVERTKVGEKVLFFDTLYLAKFGQFGDATLCSLENYEFSIVPTGAISPKSVQIDTTPGAEIYKKTYDGEILTVEYTSAMQQGLIDGHYFDADSIWFATNAASASVTAHPLSIKTQEGGFIIFDADGNEVQGNYVISTTDFGSATIEVRKIRASLPNDIQHTYDSYRVIIDLMNGDVYRTKGAVTEFLFNRAIVFEYDSGNYNPNTLGEVFVSGHSISEGKLITASANAARQAMILHQEIDFEGSVRTNYQIIYGNNFWVNIARRPVTIDPNPSGGTLSKGYDGEAYSVTLNNSMADNLLPGHTLSGTRNTFDGNVIYVGDTAQPKALNTSANLFVVDENTVDVTSNYLFSYNERFVTIYRREVKVNIAQDATVSKTKVFDNNLFIIQLTEAMMSNIALGDYLADGALSTIDPYVYTLDEENQIIYDGEDYAKKVMHISQSIKIMRAGVDATANYFVTLENNYVSITPRPLTVDMKADYPFFDFIYKGSIFEFDISNNMTTGLIAGHTISTESSPLVSDGENVGQNIDVIFPYGEVYVQDATFTHNYSFNFVPNKINIIKRDIEINVSRTGISLTKVYDTQPFIAELNEDMDSTAGEPTRGLVSGHKFVGSARTSDGFVGSSKSLNFVCDAITDRYDQGNYADNYNIIFSNITVTITQKTLYIDVNAGLPGGHSKVYDENKLTVYITPDMLSGLEGEDYLVDSGEQRSFRRTQNRNAGLYSLDTDGEGEIVIQGSAGSQNLAYNYDFNYVEAGMVRIYTRKVSVSVRNSEGYYIDSEGDLISGLRSVYADDFYIVNHTFYHIDYADGDNQNYGFELVENHYFSFGSRITAEKTANEKILLLHNERTDIRNGANDIVTSNYEIVFLDSYYEIYKRKILFDPAMNAQGETTIYDTYGSFQKQYNRQLFELQLMNYMVIEQGEYPEIVAEHFIFGGFLISADAYVARDINDNVIPKALIWDPQRPLIIYDAASNDVTANYDVDLSDTAENIVERFVTIQPQTLLIDITKGVQSSVYTKPYDGTPFTITIINGMVVEDIFGAGGFVGDLNPSGIPINKDRIRIGSGTLVTADANVSYNEENNVTDKLLYVGQEIIIENPSLVDVTSNYTIYYCKNVNTPEDWEIFKQGEAHVDYDFYRPKARITQRDLLLSINETEKIQKHYDGLPFDITFSFYNGEFTLNEGIVINPNLEELLSLSGLVSGEYAQFRLTTADGRVGAQKPWLEDALERVVLKNGTENGIKNYRITIQRNNMGHILPRQISIDVNEGGEIAQHTYSGEYYVIDITSSMVRKNKENQDLLQNLTDSLGLADGDIITGSRRSISANVGAQNLIPHNPIRIYNSLNEDITDQYVVYEYIDQKVMITPAELIVDLAGSSVPTTKVYDGLKFTINLSEEGIVSGLKLSSHYVSFGSITTADKNAGDNKPAICDLSAIRIKQAVEGEGSVDLDVTFNYTFTYVERPLTITKKGITIKAGAELYKPYNETTTVTLRPKHYTFNEGDIAAGDTVLLTAYTAAFSSPQAGSSGENIFVTELEIDNENYFLLNDSFMIVGRIVMVSPTVEVAGSTQIDGTDGVRFSYDGQPKSATFSITGLEGDPVAHEVKYQLATAAENEYLPGPPTDAGKYKMHIRTHGVDENYPQWAGAVVIIIIEPATVSIMFTGSLNQQYGEVTPITAKAVGAGGLNEDVSLVFTPTHAGYIYPGAGEYQISARFNSERENPNYTAADETRLLTIRKRNIEVTYGNTENLVYNGIVRSIAVSIRPGQVLPADAAIVTNDKLSVTYSGDSSVVRLAGNYTMTVDIINPNYNIVNNQLNFTIHKAQMTVRALVNGSSRISLNEGDDFIVTVEYEGFVSGESRLHLQKPAQLPYVPRTAVNEFQIMPSGASSLNYSFNYVPAYLTIIERKVAQIEDANGVAVVTGEYGSYVSLLASTISTDISNPEFYVINENIKSSFSSSQVLDKYKVRAAYRLTLNADNNETQDISTIKLKLSEDMKKFDTFVVLHFDENGNYEMVGAYKEGDYIVFSADSVGDFVVMTPRSGLSPNLTILLFLAPIALFVIIILFYIMFRHKYDHD